ncbi:MAG: YfiR family protein [Thermodesulfobacteria bacterium]|nr:YfiR family protein [Thermodesulfobacteriota bacterium]
MKKFCKLFIGVGFLLIFLTSTLRATTLLEYKIKTAFIYNFLKFIDLPDNKKNGKNITICVFGRKDPFGKIIDILNTKEVKGKKLKVKKIFALSQVKMCSVLFIPSGEERTEEILNYIREKKLPILTIGESPDFIDKGGIINFVIIDNKVRFEINNTIANELGIKISSRLLRLARKVK